MREKEEPYTITEKKNLVILLQKHFSRSIAKGDIK